MYKILSGYRKIYVMRNEQRVEVTVGDEITQEEFATLLSESNVDCINLINNTTVTFRAGGVVSDDTEQVVETPAIASVPDTVVPEAPATDAGRVPTDLPVGSNDTKA